MALSLNQKFPMAAEFKNTPKPNKRSFAQVVANKPVSLMHTSLTVPDVDDEQCLSTFQSRIWRAGRSPNAFLFDLTPVQKFSDMEHIKLLVGQHPKVFGVRFNKEGSRRYLEAYLSKGCDTVDIKENGIIYQEEKLRILPCCGLPEDIRVTRLALSDLPYLDKEDVLTGLTRSLSPFGKVVDVGINTDAKFGVYMGSGYALLHIPMVDPTETEVEYAALSHSISWEETSEEFHATWYNMPTWCRYCHQEGHTKFSCEKSKARIICYACYESGHRSHECPRKNPGTSKKRKTPESAKATTTKFGTPSADLLASQHANLDVSNTDVTEGLKEDLPTPTTDNNDKEEDKQGIEELHDTNDNNNILNMELDPENEKDDQDYVPSDQSDSHDDHLSDGREMEESNSMDDIEVDELVKAGIMQHEEAINSSPHITTSRRTSVQQALSGTKRKMLTSRNTRETSPSPLHQQ
jgi:hypothetical protein